MENMNTATARMFGERLFSDRSHARSEAFAIANTNGAPVVIMARDGWYSICEEPPDDAECDPIGSGWVEVEFVVDGEGAK